MIKEQEVLRAERDSLKKTVDKAATGMHSLGCSSANNSVGGGRGNGFVCSLLITSSDLPHLWYNPKQGEFFRYFFKQSILYSNTYGRQHLQTKANI